MGSFQLAAEVFSRVLALALPLFRAACSQPTAPSPEFLGTASGEHSKAPGPPQVQRGRSTSTRIAARDYPLGGNQNVVFVGSGHLAQGELYRLGLLTTFFCLLVLLVIGTPWLLFVAR